ncbi:helicase [Candidatus Acidianus copahuensis]|uniref:Helicase n=1 Tax=Candidatus Acidianus copahuensis TaxID=1160895 RepID=A0A031LKJ2_9CREN|nr:DEAD/DEAH box helicase family protein [Candidatus Acidianus copahuensis]EZQ01734.1 helicase [Candidatus Acidianus copahuensis]
MVTLRYFKGLLVSDHYAPGLSWRDETRGYTGLAYKYEEVLNYFREEGIEIKDEVIDPIPFPIIRDKLELRDYQMKALRSWFKKGKKGVIVLPTGSGKTAVGIKAISSLKVSSLIVVPTIDLLDQWSQKVEDFLGFLPGKVGGGYNEVDAITIITYDSAYARIEEIGNKFPLVIFDEVHHLPSEGYTNIAEMLASPYRLGLTATPERPDGRHTVLPRLVGPIIYRVSPSDLSGKYLAEFEMKRVYVELAEDERKQYEELRSKLNTFLKKNKISLNNLYAFHRLLRMASKNREAREALLAWHNALRIAVNSKSKIEKLREILAENRNDKIIIFTRDVDMAYSISMEFLIPAVTYKTDKDERSEILRKFKEGKYKVIVASSVLDEGVDVPDASIAVVLGGYGTSRQLLQRLGRVLRKNGDKRAQMIEIVTKRTSDYNLSRRRHNASI